MTLQELLAQAEVALGVNIHEDDYYIDPNDAYTATYEYTGNGGGVALTATWYSDGERFGNGFGKGASWIVEATHQQLPYSLITVTLMRLEDTSRVDLESLEKCLLRTIPAS